jgi:hypothetical protein
MTNYQFEINVSIKENVNRLVPFSIKFFVSIAIPPIFIEFSMVQSSYFSKKIAHIFKDQIETKDQKSCTGQHEP